MGGVQATRERGRKEPKNSAPGGMLKAAGLQHFKDPGPRAQRLPCLSLAMLTLTDKCAKTKTKTPSPNDLPEITQFFSCV